MHLYTGTSGYGYKPWKGSFYPGDLPDKQMLGFYGEHLKTVELNNTFRKMPTTASLEALAAQVPKDFKFAVKAPLQITHFKRLANVDEPLKLFLTATAALKTRLGPLLFQLPPNFKKDVPRLRDFLSMLPKAGRAAFEFRHASWFDDQVLGLLGDHKAALCIAEGEDDLKVPVAATTNWGYLRLRGDQYSPKALASWLKRIQAQKWSDAFVYFKHEDEGKGPRFAKTLLKLAK